MRKIGRRERGGSVDDVVRDISVVPCASSLEVAEKVINR